MLWNAVRDNQSLPGTRYPAPKKQFHPAILRWVLLSKRYWPLSWLGRRRRSRAQNEKSVPNQSISYPPFVQDDPQPITSPSTTLHSCDPVSAKRTALVRAFPFTKGSHTRHAMRFLTRDVRPTDRPSPQRLMGLWRMMSRTARHHSARHKTTGYWWVYGKIDANVPGESKLRHCSALPKRSSNNSISQKNWVWGTFCSLSS